MKHINRALVATLAAGILWAFIPVLGTEAGESVQATASDPGWDLTPSGSPSDIGWD